MEGIFASPRVDPEEPDSTTRSSVQKQFLKTPAANKGTPESDKQRFRELDNSGTGWKKPSGREALEFTRVCRSNNCQEFCTITTKVQVTVTFRMGLKITLIQKKNFWSSRTRPSDAWTAPNPSATSDHPSWFSLDSGKGPRKYLNVQALVFLESGNKMDGLSQPVRCSLAVLKKQHFYIFRPPVSRLRHPRAAKRFRMFATLI
ncbi:hypothetical protein K438DRAFT_228153 [Mycena galopus ATCC 62051]|nr:hypothetical protein K438DRAFT_228153 [Mycena galopus ATCC 62051]